MTTSRLVSIVIVNYNGSEFLTDLFTSIHKQTYANFEIIFVDNGSKDSSEMELRDRILPQTDLEKKTKIISLEKNSGFAHANNVGVKTAKGEWILFLNNDTVLHPEALEHMVQSIGSKNIAGVAPKIYLSKFLPTRIFDAVGVCISPNLAPYNRGIGEPDLGQYDQEEEVVGLCFAACLVDRSIFLELGGLDATYFAYFEDVDWSYRAKKHGHRFITSPQAIVYHQHSGTSNKKAYSWKYFLIFRNYLRTILKNINSKYAVRLLLGKLRDNLALLIKSKDLSIKAASFKVITSFIFFDWITYIPARRKNLATSSVRDEEILTFCNGQNLPSFDASNYQPLITLNTIKNILRLLPERIVSQDWKELEDSFYTDLVGTKWKERFSDFMRKHFEVSQEDINFLYKQLRNNEV